MVIAEVVELVKDSSRDLTQAIRTEIVARQRQRDSSRPPMNWSKNSWTTNCALYSSH